MERFSGLLGHNSIKVIEKYYSPWVAARQEQLEADVKRSSRSAADPFNWSGGQRLKPHFRSQEPASCF
jgi:hypothetical protein